MHFSATLRNSLFLVSKVRMCEKLSLRAAKSNVKIVRFPSKLRLLLSFDYFKWEDMKYERVVLRKVS